MYFKKKIAAVLPLVMSAGMATNLFNSSILMANAEETAVMTEGVSICGDVNGNGTVDAVDASTLLTHYSLISTNQKSILTDSQLKNADRNDDGVINAVDASTVLSFYTANSVNNNKVETVSTIDNNINKKILNDAGVDESEIPDWYNINLSRPAWVGEDAAGLGIGFKRKAFFPSNNDIENAEKANNSFKGFEDYKCVATIIDREIEKDNDGVLISHLLVKKDVDKICAQKIDNGKIKLKSNDVNGNFYVFFNKYKKKPDEAAFGINFKNMYLDSKDVIYTNVPIMVDDGTIIEPVSSYASESVNDEKQTALKSADKRVKNSSITSKNNVPDWFDINLSQPAWKGEKAVGIDTRCNLFKFFPSDEEIKNIEEINNYFYHMENYKCAATIVRNDGYDNSISVRHVFVRKDVEELNAIWSNENKLSFKIQGNKNQSFIGSIYKIKEDKQSAFSKWINALSDYTTVGKHDTIYTNIPIVFKNDKGEIDTVIEPYFMYGDVDDNGVYNVTDIAIIAAHINGIKTLEGDALKAADINHDGKVDYDDLPALSGHIKGIKPISQDATTTTTSATTTTKTFSTTTSITEYLEHSWTPEERFENFDIDEYKALLEEDVKSYPRRIDESIEQAYVEVMMAQVNNSSYCDQVPDKEWEEFCQLFNERVKAVYYNNPDNFTKEIHYFRNKLNRAPKTLLDLLKENAEYYRMYGEDKWQIMSAFGSSYHMFDTPACNNKGEYNLKFVSKNGLFEAVYNNDYQLLDETNDPINMGTYNYGDPNELNDAFDINSILNNNHFRLDMLTYTNEDYIQMAELINSILLIQSDKTGLKIGVTVISEILKAEKVQSKGWLNTPDSNYFNCSEFKSNYLKHTTNPLAVGHRETFESMLNNHEYYDITSDGKVHIISVG